VTLAIFSLMGVALGGLLTNGTQLFIEWRRQRREGRQALRLITENSSTPA